MQFKESFEELCSKSDSSWSRSEVTMMIDESIFKTWLQNHLEDQSFSDYFGKYFSGQTHKTEYGFRYSLSGISIGDNFYPLYLSPIKKGEKCVVEAEKSIRKMESLMRQCSEKQDFTIPSISLSVDGSYNDESLMDVCDNLDTTINFICVPKKNHTVTIGKFKGSLTKYIEKYYLSKNSEGNTFVLRKRGYYNCKNREVVFLFFRFNGSNKVSVIYSTNLSIKSKTLRRRWFHRTQIEQFFRKLKDTLKLQQSTADRCEAFFKKVSLFVLKAVFITRFQNYCKKEFNGLTFWKLRQKIIYSHCDLSIIFDQFEKGRFCKKSTLQNAKNQYFENIR